KALFYPTAVVVVAIVVTVILMLYVIPEFEKLFQGFGADLPAFTRFVIDISKFVQQTGWLLLVGAVLAVVGFLQAKKRSRAVQHFVDRAMLKIPVIGVIL